MSNEKIKIAASNYEKLLTARKRFVRGMGEVASSGLDYEVSSGIMDGMHGLIQSLSELIDTCDPVATGKGRPRKEDNDIGEALEDDPRSAEEIAADREMMATDVGMVE